MAKDLIKIFTGSDIEAKYLTSLLIDNQIKCMIQNTFEGSINAGWVSGSPENSSYILVKTEDAENAIKIVKEYLADKQ